jgi:hypothetical protein
MEVEAGERLEEALKVFTAALVVERGRAEAEAEADGGGGGREEREGVRRENDTEGGSHSGAPGGRGIWGGEGCERKLELQVAFCLSKSMCLICP